MFENRRSEFKIIADILKLAHDGARRTEILYRGNLSYFQLTSYLSFLLKKNILEEKIVRTPKGISYRIYKMTDKGKELLLDIEKTLTYLE